MKLKRMFGVSAMLLMVGSVFLFGCYEEAFPPEEIFVKIYGEARNEQAVDVLETASGFVILAHTNSGSHEVAALHAALPTVEELRAKKLVVPDGTVITYGPDDVDYLVIFTDKGGNVTQKMAFGQVETDTVLNGVVANSTDIPTSIRRTMDGGYLIVGTSTYTIKEARPKRTNQTVRQSDIFVVKLRADGSTEFQEVYGVDFYELGNAIDSELNFQIANEMGADVMEQSDGYIIFGSTTRVLPKAELPDILVDRGDFYTIKISKDGKQVIWEKTTGFAGEDRGISILPIGNDESVIMGVTSKESQNPISAGGSNVIFSRLDSRGERYGVGFYGLDGDEVPSRMHKLSDNDFYIVGTYKEMNTSRAFIMELTITSAQRFHVANIGPTDDVGVQGMDAVQVPGVGYWVVGQLDIFSDANGSTKRSEMLLMRTSTAGRVDKSYGDPVKVGGINYGGIEDDKFVRILRLNSGHLLLLGTLGFEGGSTMVCLMKANSNGELINASTP